MAFEDLITKLADLSAAAAFFLLALRVLAVALLALLIAYKSLGNRS
jgi:hypothetical protein